MATKPNISIQTNCSDLRNLNVEISTPIPSFAVTVICAYLLPIIIGFGVIGNTVSLIILNQAAKKFSSHCYLWWMAVFDIISLISHFPTFWAVILLRPYYLYLYGPNYAATWVEYSLMGPYICRISMFFTFTARTCSIYTIILVTVERFIMIVWPLKRTRLCTIFVAKTSLVIMTLTSIFINLPWFFAFNIVSKPCLLPFRAVCVGNQILIVNKMIEFIILSFVPCVIIVVCNFTIIYRLRNRLKVNLLVPTAQTRKQERDITIRLLVISFAFFILTIPSVVIVLIQAVQELRNDRSFRSRIEANVFVSSILLFAINLALNFIIYCVTGENFRLAAFSLLVCNIKDMKQYQLILAGTSSASETKTDNTDRFKHGAQNGPRFFKWHKNNVKKSTDGEGDFEPVTKLLKQKLIKTSL